MGAEKPAFQKALKFVIAQEGGYTSGAGDPGGETKYGISKRFHPSLDIKKITLGDAEAIYRRDYWAPICGDDLPAGLSLLVFDAAVNHGVGTAARCLQRVLKVPEDGEIGPRTLVALRAALRAQDAVMADYCAERAILYAENHNFQRFGRGWFRRLFLAYATALDAAGAGW